MPCNTCEIEKLSQEEEECILFHIVHQQAEKKKHTLITGFYLLITIPAETDVSHSFQGYFYHNGVVSFTSVGLHEELVCESCKL